MRNKWTRERIIRHLVEREAKGLPLTVGGEGVDSLLYEAARRTFGSWRNAVQAAGIAPERVLTWERWSPAKIFLIVRRLAQRDRPLSVAQIERRYSGMVSAARRLFGSWTKAVLAAGVTPTRLRRVVPWNKERVIETILTRALRNESLVARFIEPRSLVCAGQRHFGNWAAAVTAAGLDPKVTVLPPRRPKKPQAARPAAPRKMCPQNPRRSWTKELVIAAIHKRLQEQRSMNPSALSQEDGALYRATRRHLRSWSNALLTAGLDPAAYRRSQRGKTPTSGAGTHEQSAQSQGIDMVRPEKPA
jgi:DNA-binding protein H-NS